ncbi:hypothetical protein NL676_036187 [Syzygium grande]|nr:hypothetical protein NL676_036187 [Syzygium grande]
MGRSEDRDHAPYSCPGCPAPIIKEKLLALISGLESWARPGPIPLGPAFESNANPSKTRFFSVVFPHFLSILHLPEIEFAAGTASCEGPRWYPFGLLGGIFSYHSARMKSVRDWVFSQLLTNSLSSSRPLSGSNSFFLEAPNEGLHEQAPADSREVSQASIDQSASINGTLESQHYPSQQQGLVENCSRSHSSSDRGKSDPMSKINDLQIKFLRILQRLGHPQDNLLAAKVLYRVQLATLIQSGEADPKVLKHRHDKARAQAAQEEAAGVPELDFSFKVLVLGRTGVGKSATINSIFDQTMAVTNAFQPATDSIREVTGTVSGMKITFVDTPGLFPSSAVNMKTNRKILLSVKKDSITLGPPNAKRQPSLPHLLSSLLQHRPPPSTGGADYEIGDSILSNTEEEDEYDQLPPIKILSRAQFEKLTKSQKKDYLDELDYRETLYMKKQLREELRRQREVREDKHLEKESSDYNDCSDNQETPSEPFLLPDMAVPPSFDSDCPLHRYRGLVTGEQLLVRPVLDTHGWDHDVGFDGINLETSIETKSNVFALVTGQMSKEKNDFSIHSECSAVYKAASGPSYSVGLDVQSAGKDLIYTVHSNTKLSKLKHNITECGVSLTRIGDKCYAGAKIEDTMHIGRRVKLVVNAGRLGGAEQVAYGGSFEATVRGRDYPVRTNSVSLSMTVLSFDKEMVLSGGLQSEFRLNRDTKVLISGNLNSRKMGQLSLKTSSSEHMEIALIALVSIIRGLFRRKIPENAGVGTLESG